MASHPPTPHSSAEILIVDDDPGDAELMRMSLDFLGERMTVAFASDGEEALTWLEAEAASKEAKAALVLLDLNLPRIGGIEVLRRLRDDGRLRRISVVVLTSSAREQDRKAALQAGAAEFLTKPVSFEDLMSEIKRIVATYVRKPNAR